MTGKDYRERVQCQWKSRKRGRKRNLGREESEVYTFEWQIVHSSHPYSKILFFVSTWDSECSTESCVNLNTKKCKIRVEVCIVR